MKQIPNNEKKNWHIQYYHKKRARSENEEFRIRCEIEEINQRSNDNKTSM